MVHYAKGLALLLAFAVMTGGAEKARAQSSPAVFLQLLISNVSSSDRDFVRVSPGFFVDHLGGPSADPLPVDGLDVIFQFGAFGVSGRVEYADCIFDYDIQASAPVIGTAGPKCAFTVLTPQPSPNQVVIGLDLTD